MKKLFLCILLIISIFSINVNADDPSTIPFTLTYDYSPIEIEDLNGTKGMKYVGDTLTIDASTYKSNKEFYLTLNDDLNLHIKGNVTLTNSSSDPISFGEHKIFLTFEDDSSSLTAALSNPLYKGKLHKLYGKLIAYTPTSNTYTDDTYGYVDFSNLALVSDELTKRIYDGEEENDGDTFIATDGFIINTDAIKSLSYEDDVYTLELTDYSDARLYVELLFNESEIFRTIDYEFVDIDLTTTVAAPSTTYDIEVANKITGPMYKLDDNYYYAFYITMALNPGIEEHEDFSMMLTGLNNAHKYINVRFKTTPFNNPPTNKPNNNPSYKVPDTSVK